MTELTFHTAVTGAVLGTAGLVFAALFITTAPYGRHQRGGWGPQIPSRLGWVVMESPAVLVFAAVFALGDHAWNTVPLLLLAAWQVHYVHRTFVFPFRLRAAGKTMPLSVAMMAFLFNGVNAYLNARWISHLGVYADSWLTQPTFWMGLSVFVIGLGINLHADHVLLTLRAPGDSGYRVPRGGLYRFVSCPNYLGEILEWAGWALACWSAAGGAFFVFTVANLVPRAIANHRWYLRNFPDYPPERSALLPRLL